MPPTLTKEQENQTVSTGRTLNDVFQEVRGNGGLSIQSAVLPAQATQFQVDVPDTIPSTAATTNVTPQDVLTRRAQAEREQVANINSQQGFDSFLSSIGSTSQPNDVNSVISSFIFNPPATQATQQRDQFIQDQNQNIQNVRDLQSNRSSQADRREELRTDAGLPEAEQRIAAVGEELAQLTGDFSRFTAGLENEAGQTRIGFEARLNPAQRQYIAEVGALSALQQALQGNVQAAQQNINQVLQLEFQDEQRAIDDAYSELNLTQQQINNLEPQLQEEAQRRAQALQLALQRRQELLAQQQQDRAQALQYAMIAGQNGAPAGVVRQIAGAQSADQALGFAGNYLRDPNESLRGSLLSEQLRGQQLENQLTQKELNAVSETSSGTANPAINAISNFAFKLQENQREALTTAVTNAVKAGDQEGVEIALRNAVQAAEGKTATSEVIGRDAAIASLLDISSLLQTYREAGGETGLLVGGYEDLANRLGKTTDPQLAEIENRIVGAIQSYRKAVSGAAFTESESKEYERLFPSTSNQFELNQAKINSMVDTFELNNRVFYGNSLGGKSPAEIAEEAVLVELYAKASPEQQQLIDLSLNASVPNELVFQPN